MRLALGKKEFMCLVVLETGTDSLAEDLSVKLYDLGFAAVPLLLLCLSFVQVLEACTWELL